MVYAFVVAIKVKERCIHLSIAIIHVSTYMYIVLHINVIVLIVHSLVYKSMCLSGWMVELYVLINRTYAYLCTCTLKSSAHVTSHDALRSRKTSSTK